MHEFSLTADLMGKIEVEQFDKATFAQVPLRLTGVPEKPIEVHPDAAGNYRVGSSTIWQLGKQRLNLYLPWRFAIRWGWAMSTSLCRPTRVISIRPPRISISETSRLPDW